MFSKTLFHSISTVGINDCKKIWHWIESNLVFGGIKSLDNKWVDLLSLSWFYARFLELQESNTKWASSWIDLKLLSSLRIEVIVIESCANFAINVIDSKTHMAYCQTQASCDADSRFRLESLASQSISGFKNQLQNRITLKCIEF